MKQEGSKNTANKKPHPNGDPPMPGGTLRSAHASQEPKPTGDLALLHLIEMLGSPNPETRANAAHELGEIGRPVGRARRLAERLDQIHPRQHIADVRAIEPLIAALRDQDSGVRASAVGALGKIGDARAVEPLIAVLQNEDQWEMRLRVAMELARLGNERGSDIFIAALQDSKADVRRVAAQTICIVGGTWAWAVEPLIAALQDSDSLVRLSAAEALGTIGDRRAIEPLTMARQNNDPVVSMMAGTALFKIEHQLK